MQEEEDIAPEPIFRPAKRRKFIRRRQDEGDDTNPDTVTATSTPDQTVATNKDQTTTEPNDNEETTNSPNLVRLRRPNPARKGGIGFSATSRLGQEGGSRSNSVIPGDPEKERVQAMADRFTGNSGQTVDVNKHMYV